MRIVKAGVGYFALVFGAGFMMGVVRVLFLVPRLGERSAELLEMPLMLLVIVLSARFVVNRYTLPLSVRVRLATGFIALALLLAAEFSLVTVLQDRSLDEYIASRDAVSGSVYLVMLGVFAAMPLILARLRRVDRRMA